jgi:hypothetical protein
LARFDHIPWLDAVVGRKPLALLAGRHKTQVFLAPMQGGFKLPYRNADGAAPAPLNRRIAAAVIGVQVGVDQAGQGLRTQSMAHQRHRLLSMQAVAAVDQHRAAALAVQQDVVGREPASFQQGQSFEGGVNLGSLHLMCAWTSYVVAAFLPIAGWRALAGLPFERFALHAP